MNYPLISEYVDAIKAAEDNFDQLKHLCPVLDEDGQPVMTSGNFAVVFKMKDAQTGKLYAVKCFTREQEGREEAYRLIDDELKRVDSPYLTSIRYLDKELFVDTSQSIETEFPVLLMDWVEGKTLDKYLRENLDDKYALEMLAYRFSHLALFLISQPFAHGDLKPDNILVQGDGFLVLVDYDGMYVPAMKGQKARELGSPDFRHPQRTEDDFDEYIDDFPLVSILLSLKAISISPQLLDEYGASDRLLFSQYDYSNMANSQVMSTFNKLINNPELATLQSLFILVYNQRSLSQLSFLLFDILGPLDMDYEGMDTEVTEEDLANGWTDEYGATYSQDRRRLLKIDKVRVHDTIYAIKEGTEVICNKSLFYCYDVIVIPKSVRIIATDAINPDPIHGTVPKKFINKSPHAVLINDVLFSANYQNLIWCSPEKKDTLYIPAAVRSIGTYAIYLNRLSSIVVDVNNPVYDSRNNCNAVIESSLNALILGCKITSIPDNVTSIGNKAFMNCLGLTSIRIPTNVTCIGNNAFYKCRLSQIEIPNGVTDIGDKAFSYNRLSHVEIPRSVTNIGSAVFYGCRLSSIKVESDNKVYDSRDGCNAIIKTVSNTIIQGCKNTVIPEDIVAIGSNAFASCELTSIQIPHSITSIGERAFEGCSLLKTMTIPNSITSIGEYAFKFSGLEQIQLDCNIREIKEGLFQMSKIKSITLPESVEVIGRYAFDDSFLERIILPSSLLHISGYAFSETRLTEIVLPSNIQTIDEMAFKWCFSLNKIYVPKNRKQYYKKKLSKCLIGSYLDKYEGQDTPFYASEIIVEMK